LRIQKRLDFMTGLSAQKESLRSAFGGMGLNTNLQNPKLSKMRLSISRGSRL
jgi:hypothetical protein